MEHLQYIDNLLSEVLTYVLEKKQSLDLLDMTRDIFERVTTYYFHLPVHEKSPFREAWFAFMHLINKTAYKSSEDRLLTSLLITPASITTIKNIDTYLFPEILKIATDQGIFNRYTDDGGDSYILFLIQKMIDVIHSDYLTSLNFPFLCLTFKHILSLCSTECARQAFRYYVDIHSPECSSIAQHTEWRLDHPYIRLLFVGKTILLVSDNRVEIEEVDPTEFCLYISSFKTVTEEDTDIIL